MGTVRYAARASELPDYDYDAVAGEQHIRTIIGRFAIYCGTLRRSLAEVASLEEPATEDLLAGALRRTELVMWKLESHLLPDRAPVHREAVNAPRVLEAAASVHPDADEPELELAVPAPSPSNTQPRSL